MPRSTVAAAAAVLLAVSLSTPTASAHEAGDWILRVGATRVGPDESSSLVSTTATGPLPGTEVKVGDNTQVGVNLVYMWTDSIGIEVLAATPFDHDLTVTGLDAYGFDTRKLGSTKHLPPTLTANYYFLAPQSAIRPYVGVGINYTTFFSESLRSFPESELGAHGLELEDSVGLAWRGGVDWELNQNWLLNASFWKIDLETDARFDSDLGRVKVNVDVDPWVFMLSLGYLF